MNLKFTLIEYHKYEAREGAKKMGEIQQMIYDQGDAHGFVRDKEEGRTEGLTVCRKKSPTS